MNRIKIKPSLQVVRIVCILAGIAGFFYVVVGTLVVGGCLLVGSVLFEKRLLRCPRCGHKLQISMPLHKEAICPGCMQGLHS